MSEHDVNTIMVMGFTRTQAQKALMSNNNNLENALEFLLGNDVAGNDIDDNYQNNNQNNNYDRYDDEPVRINNNYNNNNNYVPNKNRNIRRSGEEETEAAMIREQIGIIERDIRSHNQLTYSLKCRATPFLQEYKEMQSRIRSYIESDPDFVADLLSISDRMDEVLNAYQALEKKEKQAINNNNISVYEDSSEGNYVPLNSSKPELKKEEDNYTKDIHQLRKTKSIFLVPVKHYDPANTEEFECSICLEDVKVGEGYVLEHCKHSFCKSCLGVLDIPCPDQNCDKTLGGMGYYDVKLLVDDVNFRKYEEFCFVAALKTDPNMRWCPNPKGCTNAFIYDPDNKDKKLICSECKYDFCCDCNEPWHSGTCQDYQTWKTENSLEDKKFSEWKKANTKPCPKCKVRTQKNAGCNHMTCGGCKHEWCWLCDGKYTSNHYDIYNVLGCPGMHFDGTENGGNNNDPALARAGYRKALGRKVMIGTGLAVGIPLAVPLGVGLIGAGVVLAAPFALVAGGVYGGYKIKKALK